MQLEEAGMLLPELQLRTALQAGAAVSEWNARNAKHVQSKTACTPIFLDEGDIQRLQIGVLCTLAKSLQQTYHKKASMPAVCLDESMRKAERQLQQACENSAADVKAKGCFNQTDQDCPLHQCYGNPQLQYKTAGGAHQETNPAASAAYPAPFPRFGFLQGSWTFTT
ncbi:MAG: hypothetical protein FRX49_12216 [Trebouxia sp. A1-2]|nr:MAG: hypothetical protein FRX49_12216 [Trebouxia sp. A1-2]